MKVQFNVNAKKHVAAAGVDVGVLSQQKKQALALGLARPLLSPNVSIQIHISPTWNSISRLIVKV